MQARRTARELALLCISQLPTQSQPLPLEEKKIEDIITAAVRSLTDEVKEMLELAGAELQRGQDRVLNSATRAPDLKSAQAMVTEAINLTETAINRVGLALEFPEILQHARQGEVRDYTVHLLSTIDTERIAIDELINNALVDWQLDRLANIDQNILRIAVAEIVYLKLAAAVAINEAVELAKRYSSEDGYRFINGVLRSISGQVKTDTAHLFS